MQTLKLLRRCSLLSRTCLRYNSSSTETHFGYSTIDAAEKTDRVQEVFSRVSSKYDLMNDAMSLGVHRCWKDAFVARMNVGDGDDVVDVASGTADVAIRILDNSNNISVTCTDLNASMLDIARDRLKHYSNVKFEVANAESLPFASDSFDLYCIAFGIRNVTHVDKALEEAYRVLRPGGRFMCLEFSNVDVPLLSQLYDFYSFEIIPPLGKVIAGDWDSYEYLVQSIRRFPDQNTFKEMIEAAGFSAVTYENLTGGVAAIHSGFKLVRPKVTPDKSTKRDSTSSSKVSSDLGPNQVAQS